MVHFLVGVAALVFIIKNWSTVSQIFWITVGIVCACLYPVLYLIGGVIAIGLYFAAFYSIAGVTTWITQVIPSASLAMLAVASPFIMLAIAAYFIYRKD